jgi:hypothetical protein
MTTLFIDEFLRKRELDGQRLQAMILTDNPEIVRCDLS